MAEIPITADVLARLKPGDRIRHSDGDDFTLVERKADDSGWWLPARSGVDDRALTGGYWSLVEATLRLGRRVECHVYDGDRELFTVPRDYAWLAPLLVERFNQAGCPHVVADGGTSHCGLAQSTAQEVEQLRASAKLHMGAHWSSVESFIGMGEAIMTSIAEAGTVGDVLEIVGNWMNGRDAVDEAAEELFDRAKAAATTGQRRAVVAESIYQRYVDGYHPVWHERIEPPTWNSHVPGRDDTEPMTPDQVAWLRGEPLPACSTCRDSGLVPQSPGQPGDGPAPCPDCGPTS